MDRRFSCFAGAGRFGPAVIALLICSSNAGAATVAAQWNFNDAANATTSVANVGGYVGTFNAPGGRTAAGGGVSGVAGDYAFDIAAGAGAMISNTPGFLAALNALAGTQAMSISWWQFLDATPNSFAFWATSPSSNGSGRGLGSHAPWADGNAYFDTSGCCDAATQRIVGPLGATLGTWQLIAMTYANGTKNIYRNTTVIATGAGGAPLVTDNNALFVGNSFSLDGGMDAKIDNFTLWNGALSAAEVAALAVRPVPEPTVALLGMIGLLGVSRFRRH